MLQAVLKALVDTWDAGKVFSGRHCSLCCHSMNKTGCKSCVLDDGKKKFGCTGQYGRPRAERFEISCVEERVGRGFGNQGPSMLGLEAGLEEIERLACITAIMR
jgi:hypothetical protein